MKEELAATQYRLGAMENQLFILKAEALKNAGDVLLFEEELPSDSLRRLTDSILQVCSGRCAVFAGSDRNFKYAIGCQEGDLRELSKKLNAALNGRGGGKPNFVQGSLAANKEEIETFFQSEDLA